VLVVQGPTNSLPKRDVGARLNKQAENIGFSFDQHTSTYLLTNICNIEHEELKAFYLEHGRYGMSEMLHKHLMNWITQQRRKHKDSKSSDG